MKKIKLFGFDLDGTLLTPEKGVSTYTRKTLERCAKQQIMLVPVTGRPLHGIPESVRSIPYLTHLICSNGAMTVDLRRGQVLRRKTMPLELVLKILRQIPSHGVIREVFIGGYGYCDRETAALWKQRNLIEAQRIYLRESRRIVDDLPDFLEHLSFDGEEVRKYGISQEHLAEDINISAGSAEMQKHILANLDDVKDECHIVESFSTDLEFGALHADKGEAFIELASAYGITAGETAAFGDGGNDIDLLQAAGMAVAMGNAIEKIKDMADFVTDDNAHDGVAKGIIKLLRI